MTPDDRWRVTHMVEAAEQALGFVRGRDRADLQIAFLHSRSAKLENGIA